MAMHNPPHPGEFIIQVYLEPNNLSGRELAGKLDVAASTLNRILTGTSRISPEMALRLSKALGRSPESWFAMQYNHDLWHAKQHVKLGKVGKSLERLMAPTLYRSYANVPMSITNRNFTSPRKTRS